MLPDPGTPAIATTRPAGGLVIVLLLFTRLVQDPLGHTVSPRRYVDGNAPAELVGFRGDVQRRFVR